MFITKKHLTRRTALRGLGTALALPLLDAMIRAPLWRKRRRKPRRTLDSFTSPTAP
jgi:hypothetical protein